MNKLCLDELLPAFIREKENTDIYVVKAGENHCPRFSDREYHRVSVTIEPRTSTFKVQIKVERALRKTPSTRDSNSALILNIPSNECTKWFF